MALPWAPRYQHAADAIASRIKPITYAATNDWLKAQGMEFAPEEDHDAVLDNSELRRMAKGGEKQSKLKFVTHKVPAEHSLLAQQQWAQAQAQAYKGEPKGGKS